jgi:hypothetical protein
VAVILDNTTVNDNSLWKSVLPKARFNSITLEYNSDYELPGGDNPHIINEKWEPSNKTTATLLEEINSAKLKVTIDLIVKEKIGDFLTKTWFDNEVVRKCVRIQLWRATTPQAAATLKNAVFSATLWEGGPPPLGLFPGCHLVATRALGEYVQPPMGDADVEDTSAVAEQMPGFYKSTSYDGSESYDLTYRFSDQVMNSKPSYLSYFAIVTLDWDAMQEVFGGHQYWPSGDIPVPLEKTSEIVFVNGSVVSTAEVFRYNEGPDKGQIYMGPIHQMANGAYMEGATHVESNQEHEHSPPPQYRLEKIKVPNATIKDFRDFSYLEKLNLDFSIFNSAYMPKLLGVKFTDDQRPKAAKNPAYFMDALLSRDKTGRCRFLFGVDYTRIMLENSVFPKYFMSSHKNSSDNVSKLLSKSRILSFRVLRRRVKEDPSIFGSRVSSPTYSHVFDPDDNGAPKESEKIIIDAGRDKFTMSGDPGKVSHYEETVFEKNSVNETIEIARKIGSLREIELNLTNGDDVISKYKFYSGVDHEVRLKTDGWYQYAVELEIYDGTADVLKEQIVTARNSIELIKQYLSLAESDPKFYDVASNRFTQLFIDRIKEEWPGTDQNRPYAIAMKQLYDQGGVLPFLTNNYDPAFMKLSTITKTEISWRMTELRNKLMTFCSPEAGNLRGIRETIRTMEPVVYNLSKQLGEFIEMNPGFRPAVVAQGGAVSMPTHSADNGFRQRVFKIKVYHEGVFDSDTPRNVGYDYLSTSFGQVTPKNIIGPKKLSAQDYALRTEKEIKKFIGEINEYQSVLDAAPFSPLGGDSVETSRYSYLGLSQAYIGDDGEKTPFPGEPGANGNPEATEDYLFIDRLPIGELINLATVDGTNDTSGTQASKLLINTLRFNTSKESTGARTIQSIEEEISNISVVPYAFFKDLFYSRMQEKNSLKRMLALENCTIETASSVLPEMLISPEFTLEPDDIGSISPMTVPIGNFQSFPNGTGDNPSTGKKEENEVGISTAADSVNKYNVDIQRKAYLSLFKTLAIFNHIENPYATIDSPEECESIARFDYKATQFAYNYGPPASEHIVPTDMLQQPNHIKFMIYNLANLVSGKGFTSADLMINPKTFAFMHYLIENIMVVEYLAGFEGNKSEPFNNFPFGTKQIQAPLWEKLTSDVFTELSSGPRGGEVVCRLRPYRHKDLSVKQKPSFMLPLYNEYFVIDFGMVSAGWNIPADRSPDRTRTDRILTPWQIRSADVLGQNDPRGPEYEEVRVTDPRPRSRAVNAGTISPWWLNPRAGEGTTAGKQAKAKARLHGGATPGKTYKTPYHKGSGGGLNKGMLSGKSYPRRESGDGVVEWVSLPQGGQPPEGTNYDGADADAIAAWRAEIAADYDQARRRKKKQQEDSTDDDDRRRDRKEYDED